MAKSNFYAGAGLDRAAHRRCDADWVRARLADPETRIVPVWRARNLVATNGDGAPAPEPVLLSPAESRDHIEAALRDGPAELILLGTAGEVAHFALDLSHLEDDAAVAAGRGVFTDLRAVGARMGRAQGALLAYARGIVTWHQRHRFCGSCGSPTASVDAGHVRRCANPDCGSQHFPRTDPAVIMLVSKGDRALLGRQAAWPKGMYSTLAGFVEPGESLEEAVAREVQEETGIRVRNVRYSSSQPWPFPSSLMLGFHAEAIDDEIRLAADELEDARWVSRDFVASHEPDEGFRTPRADSIAWRLIRDWLLRG